MKKFLFLLIVVLAFGCSNYQPTTTDSFKERAVKRTNGELQVTMSALGGIEAKQTFGVDLVNRNIQPVWVEIKNSSSTPYLLLPIRTDPNYFSPAEVAYITRHWFSPTKNKQLDINFKKLAIPHLVPPQQNQSGFIYTEMNPGLKYIDVTLLGPSELKDFRAVVEVPGIKADYQDVDFENLYPPNNIVDGDEKKLRMELEKMPCCTENKNGKRKGDPLNLVFIGNFKSILTALVGGGWEVTEELSFRSVWRTIRAFVLREEYRHSPVSSLYLFGRRQDASFQKARRTINERNHLRIWLTPLRVNGIPVWIGQISRDIGIKLTFKSPFLTTHVIDPDVDNDRFYLIQNSIMAEALSKLGYVKGVGIATLEDNRSTLGGDPYFTDGLRAVLQCSESPVNLPNIRFFDWEFPPEIKHYHDMLQ